VKRICFASGNKHKVAEIAAMLAPRGWAVEPLVLTVEEDAPTFAGNAEKKARAALAQSGLLAALAGVPDERRTARFRCALVFVDGDGTRLVAEGACEGRIGHVGRGSGGFGYDPLFLVGEDALGRTMAELAPEEKNRISHRAKALAKMVDALANR
jgi:XTP/dITP diphosphohydrolase